MAARGPQNGRRGLERCEPLGFWAFQATFFDPSTPSMRKGHDREKWGKNRRGEKKRKKRLMIIVASNVVASRPPERRPTGTPHTRANNENREDDILERRLVFNQFFFNVLNFDKVS